MLRRIPVDTRTERIGSVFIHFDDSTGGGSSWGGRHRRSGSAVAQADGWGGIRTDGGREPTPVFKTRALNRACSAQEVEAWRPRDDRVQPGNRALDHDHP